MMYNPPSPAQSDRPDSPTPFTRIFSAAKQSIASLSPTAPLILGRIRGTGPGVSFGAMIQELETTHPITLQYPFEGSHLVGGAVWDNPLNTSSFPTAPPSEPQSPQEHTNHPPAIAKLRWLEHADDLPMHTHAFSDRFIIVLDGRGFFHWSDQDAETFDGSSVQTIAARSRDVFVFRRGLVHTFSTQEHAMTLLSVQWPYYAFTDPRQYQLPGFWWTAGEQMHTLPPRVICDLHTPSTPCAI